MKIKTVEIELTLEQVEWLHSYCQILALMIMIKVGKLKSRYLKKLIYAKQ